MYPVFVGDVLIRNTQAFNNVDALTLRERIVTVDGAWRDYHTFVGIDPPQH
jgi:hypothetical protein